MGSHTVSACQGGGRMPRRVMRQGSGRAVAVAAAVLSAMAWLSQERLFALAGSSRLGQRRSQSTPLQLRSIAPTLPQAPVSDGHAAEGEVSEQVLQARARLAAGSNFFALTTEADLASLLADVAEAGRLLVVDYYAPWCRACQKLLRYMHKIARSEKFSGVTFASVDFERSRDLCKSRSVEKLPTLEIYRGQDLRQRWAGASNKRLLERLEGEMEEMEDVAEVARKQTSLEDAEQMISR
eukprot:TRINITY_DN78753_c0_g1_i1.p1 TRINITY_DN78753_c0_g1~~TRINITY_DN78753_c0_g1_i1.p1  ORF type:complete len:239 (-),score=56.25 TRINITY_DN78753_c0_g1_i1:53-769(-)